MLVSKNNNMTQNIHYIKNILNYIINWIEKYEICSKRLKLIERWSKLNFDGNWNPHWQREFNLCSKVVDLAYVEYHQLSSNYSSSSLCPFNTKSKQWKRHLFSIRLDIINLSYSLAPDHQHHTLRLMTWWQPPSTFHSLSQSLRLVSLLHRHDLHMEKKIQPISSSQIAHTCWH